MKTEFKHLQAAHCENGVTTNLLRSVGVDKITEPLSFGIGSGLFFVYILTLILSGPLKFPVYISVPMLVTTVIICIVVGILAGIIPARRAAKMDPVVAIRS